MGTDEDLGAAQLIPGGDVSGKLCLDDPTQAGLYVLSFELEPGLAVSSPRGVWLVRQGSPGALTQVNPDGAEQTLAAPFQSSGVAGIGPGAAGRNSSRRSEHYQCCAGAPLRGTRPRPEAPLHTCA